MCETCQHIEVNKTLVVNKNYDPTRTTTLRNMMVRESNRRFKMIEQAIFKAIVTENVFGFEVLQSTPGRGAYKFLSDDRKIQECIIWLQGLIDDDIIELQGFPSTRIPKNWLFKYLQTAYQRGVARAREELRKAGYNVPTIVASGGLATVMSVPVHVDSLALLYTRVFNDLKGITDAMQQQIGRLLAEGFASGANPRVIARRLVAAINGAKMGDLGITDSLGRFIPARRRAEILARTEIIRAHHYANINEYKTWGVYGVEVMAEWRTAGDNRVCIQCSSLEGNTYTLDEILPMIPAHPQCRCIAIPIIKNKN